MTTAKQAKKPVAKKTTAKASAQKVETTVNESIDDVTEVIEEVTQDVTQDVTQVIENVSEEVTEKATSAVAALNENFGKLQSAAKQVWFANLGLYGRSVEEVQDRYSKANDELQARFSQLKEDRQKLVKELVVRGEKVQDDAEVLFKEGRANIEEQIEVAKTRITGFASVIDIPARLQDMSDRLEKLSKDLKKTA